ncbi:MAG: muramoyltetrapeptide carboxypeptidase [Burkholderiaceae bacterium]
MNATSPLRPAIVGIVAPSGYASDTTQIDRATALLQARGYQARVFFDRSACFQRFAATDTLRLEGLHAAACDSEVDIILALRGGYGLSRLLPEIDFPMLARSGKRFVGHSDFTALQMGLLVHGGHSFAGPMICSDFGRADVSEFTMRHFWQCLQGPECSVALALPASGSVANDSVLAEGLLWGGNLAMLAHLAGTPWMPSIQGGILFLEDIHEHPFRVERMLLQLLHAGVLGQQKAILLGDFSGGQTAEYDNGYSFAAMLAFIRSRVDIPVVTGLQFGHIHHKVTLAIGAQGCLSVGSSGGTLHMSGYRLSDAVRTP